MKGRVNDMTKMRSLPRAFRFMRGNVLILTVTNLLGMFCRSMVFPYASLYILALGGKPTQIGLINSLRPLAGLIMFPIAGYLADHAGRVKLIGLASYLSGAICLLYVFAPSWQVIAVAGLLGGFMVFQFPPSSAIIADSLSPQDRGRGIALMTTLASIPAMFSPYLAGALIDRRGVDVGMRYLYGFLAAASLLSAAISLRFLKETPRPSETRLDLSHLPTAFRNAYAGVPTILKHLPRSLKALSLVIILGFMANAVAGPFWVVYALEHIGLSSTEWGLVLLIETVLRNVMYIPAGLMVDRWGRTRWMLASLLLSLVSVPAFALSSSFVAVLLIRAAVALANAFFLPACSALMADTVPRDKRGRVMAALGRGTVMIGAASGGTGGPGVGFLVTIPLMIASLAGGYLYTCNPAYPWAFVLVTTLIAFIVSALFIRDPKKAET